MRLTGAKVFVIDGGEFIGNFVVSEFPRTDAEQVVMYDNFTRGK